jgi:hypothetical protein
VLSDLVGERIIRGWKQRSRNDRRKWNSELITTPEGTKRYHASVEKKLEATNTIEPGSQDRNKMWYVM